VKVSLENNRKRQFKAREKAQHFGVRVLASGLFCGDEENSNAKDAKDAKDAKE